MMIFVIIVAATTKSNSMQTTTSSAAGNDTDYYDDFNSTEIGDELSEDIIIINVFKLPNATLMSENNSSQHQPS